MYTLPTDILTEVNVLNVYSCFSCSQVGPLHCGNSFGNSKVLQRVDRRIT